MAYNFAHGSLVAIQIGGQYFAALGISWTDELSEVQDVTYTVSGTNTVAILLPGYHKAGGTIEAVWDGNNLPLITPGTVVALIFTLDGISLFNLSAFIVKNDVPSAGPTKGPVKVSIEFATTGSYTAP